MPRKWEDALRKGVYHVGTALESAIAAAEKIGAGIKGSSASTQPVLSLEGQLSIQKLKEVIGQAVDRTLMPSIPGLIDRTALELREGPASLAKSFKEKGASVSIHADIGGGAATQGRPDPGIFSVRCVNSKLPFEDGFFDFAIGVYASQFQGDILKALKELSRVISISGEGVIVDFHPFGMYAKRGSMRIRPITSIVRGIEDYYKICRSSGLRITNIRESFFDETVRPLFITEDERSAFRIIRETPILVYLFVKKGG